MKCLVVMSAVAFVAAGPAAATPLEEAMASCRPAADPNSKVAACTFVIENSHDRRTLLRAYNTRGLALCDLDRCAEAVSDFDHVVAFDSSIAGYFDNRARALRAANRLPEAIADSERAIRMAPTYAFTYMGKAHTQDAAGQYERALTTVEQAPAIDPRASGNWEFRGKMFAKLHRWSEAYAAFDRALTLDPSDTSVYKTRAEAEEAQGDLEAALADYERYPASEDDAQDVAKAKEEIRARMRERSEGGARADLTKRIEALEAEKRAAGDRASAAERRAEQERERADKEKKRADLETQRSNRAEPPSRGNVGSPTPALDRAVDPGEADRLKASVIDLEGQVAALRDVLREQKRLADSPGANAQMIKITATLVDKQLAERRAELSAKQGHLDLYVKARPAEKERLLKAPRPDRAFPRVPYFNAATRETGELWIEPTLDPADKLIYQIRVVATRAGPDMARETIALTPTELAQTQAALTRIRGWSLKAYEAGIRRSYSKRAACFPQTDCPDEGSSMEGKPFTELRFIIREDGSTVARLQRGSGRAIFSADLASDPSLLFGAYISHAEAIAAQDFKGPRNKGHLDKLFQ